MSLSGHCLYVFTNNIEEFQFYERVQVSPTVQKLSNIKICKDLLKSRVLKSTVLSVFSKCSSLKFSNQVFKWIQNPLQIYPSIIIHLDTFTSNVSLICTKCTFQILVIYPGIFSFPSQLQFYVSYGADFLHLFSSFVRVVPLYVKTCTWWHYWLFFFLIEATFVWTTLKLYKRNVAFNR